MSHSIRKLIQNEVQMAAGLSKLSLDLKSDSAAATLSLFLRSFRGRVDYAELVGHSDSFIDQLEAIRNLIAVNKIDEASKRIALLKPSNLAEEAEIGLEQTRLFMMKSDYERALEVSRITFLNRELSDTSRLTLLQIRGHAFISLNEFEKAIDELNKAITLADFYTAAASGYSARAFLVVVLSKQKRFEEAQLALQCLANRVAELEDTDLWVDRLLLVLRSEAHFYREFEKIELLHQSLVEARTLAAWLGDLATLKKCQAELDLIKDKKFSMDVVAEFSGWKYLPRQGLILTEAPKSVQRIADFKVLRTLLEHLVEQPSSGYESLFEHTWGLKYHPDRHAGHLRSNLSKLRKLLPKDSLIVEGGRVRLK